MTVNTKGLIEVAASDAMNEASTCSDDMVFMVLIVSVLPVTEAVSAMKLETSALVAKGSGCSDESLLIALIVSVSRWSVTDAVSSDLVDEAYTCSDDSVLTAMIMSVWSLIEVVSTVKLETSNLVDEMSDCASDSVLIALIMSVLSITDVVPVMKLTTSGLVDEASGCFDDSVLTAMIMSVWSVIEGVSAASNESVFVLIGIGEVSLLSVVDMVDEIGFDEKSGRYGLKCRQK